MQPNLKHKAISLLCVYIFKKSVALVIVLHEVTIEISGLLQNALAQTNALPLLIGKQYTFIALMVDHPYKK